MGKSWGLVKKELEYKWLANSLRGRVEYIVVNFTDETDQYEQLEISIDGDVVHETSDANFHKTYHSALERTHHNPLNHAYDAGDISKFLFFQIYNDYSINDIDYSLHSQNPFLRLLAIMDGRVTVETLSLLNPGLFTSPSWLYTFYKLRMEAEGLPLSIGGSYE